ncbi:MAG: tripartite tricarboxylate transporter substrate binding protein [Betaproteobacteria bacterium]|nr:tripartite tricarboxylate transporter substrate binding protein [Betaproteobacteria bacterium]
MEQLSKQLGQPVLVENRVGAGGTLGNNQVAKAAPDGYTVLSTSSGYTSIPFIYKTLSYSNSELAPVTPLANQPLALIIAPAKNLATVAALVASAKANRDKVNYVSGGIGSATHIAVEKFLLVAGIGGTHIPFKGAAEVLTEVGTGRVDFAFIPILSSLSTIRDKKLLALAVSAGERSSILPEVPTIREAGFPDALYNFWVGLLVPAKTPKDIIARLHEETTKAMKEQDVAARLARSGAEPMFMNPQQFEAYLAQETAADEKIVKAAGLTGTQN